MNKKFSTLVATLLASGGLVYAVDAMILPMSNGVAGKYAAVVADTKAGEDVAEAVVACKAEKSTDYVNAWKIKVSSDVRYLEVKNAEGWFLCKDNTIQKLEESELSEKAVAITVGAEGALDNLSFDASTGAVSVVEGGGTAKLYTGDQTAAGASVVGGTEVALGNTVYVNVSVVKVSISTDAPGAAVEGMDEAGVSVSDKGVITVPDGAPEVTGIPAPFTVKSAAKGFLTAKGWDGEAKVGESWILEEKHLKNLAAEKAGEKKIYLGSATTKAADGSYALVEKGSALKVSLVKEGLKIGENSTPINVTLTTTGASLAVSGADTEVSSGNIVKVVGYETKTYKITVTKINDDLYSYELIECDKHGYVTEGTSSLGVFFGGKYDGSVSLKNQDGKFVKFNNGFFETSTNQESTGFKVVKAEVDSKAYNVQKLLNDFGIRTSFGVTLKHKYIDEDGEDATKAITVGNVFADAELVPVKYDASAADGKKLVEITGDDSEAATTSTFLLKSGDRYIVLETTEDSEWTSINNELTNGGYKFTTLGEEAMLKILANGNKLDDRSFAPYFTFNYDNVTNEDGEGKTVYNIEVKTAVSGGTSYTVSSFEVKSGAQKGVYLTVSNEKSHWVAAELGSNNMVKAKSDHSPLNHRYVNIAFANHPSIKDKAGKVINGRVPHANAETTADKSEFLFNKPEGQWAVQVVGTNDGELDKKGVADKKDATSFTFRNRESGETFVVIGLYWLGDNKYAVSYSDTNDDKFAKDPASRDTMIITGIDTELKFGKVQRDGYADLKAADVQDKQFNLLVASTEEDYYVGENHSAKYHFLGLSHEETAAVNWRIVPLTGAREFDADGILKTASDSVYIFNYSQYFGADDKLFSNNDTIAIVSYALQNTENGEYLTYEDPQTTSILSMICDPNFKSFKTTKEVKDAHRFILKEKADGLYNIVSVDGGDKEYTVKDGVLTYPVNEGDFFPYYELGDSKLYGATTLTKQGAVEVEDIYTQINSNDLFKVQEVAAPEYRKLAQGDTIRIFREENNFDTMYENGEFLNLGNTAQLTEMAPALYVDTAYVNRGTNNRYQYLLVVNPTRIDEEKCNHKPADHPMIHPDTTYGRFLVNLIDSAVYAYKNGAIHSNKYINDKEADETYVKLGFVWGYRSGDELCLTEGQDFTKVKERIDLSTRDFNIAKFAFRYVNPTDADDKSFKIQTAYIDYNVAKDAKKADWEVTNDGYLKTINGVVVVTKDYARGEEFNLDAEESTPTANEGIAAEGVSVVATNGAIIVKGAEGKNVVITNVLGQQVANTVVTSSEATIAAPAGIVVVAVEGEAAVKAIVK